MSLTLDGIEDVAPEKVDRKIDSGIDSGKDLWIDRKLYRKIDSWVESCRHRSEFRIINFLDGRIDRKIDFGKIAVR